MIASARIGVSLFFFGRRAPGDRPCSVAAARPAITGAQRGNRPSRRGPDRTAPELPDRRYLRHTPAELSLVTRVPRRAALANRGAHVDDQLLQCDTSRAPRTVSEARAPAFGCRAAGDTHLADCVPRSRSVRARPASSRRGSRSARRTAPDGGWWERARRRPRGDAPGRVPLPTGTGPRSPSHRGRVGVCVGREPTTTNRERRAVRRAIGSRTGGDALSRIAYPDRGASELVLRAPGVDRAALAERLRTVGGGNVPGDDREATPRVEYRCPPAPVLGHCPIGDGLACVLDASRPPRTWASGSWPPIGPRRLQRVVDRPIAHRSVMSGLRTLPVCALDFS